MYDVCIMYLKFASNLFINEIHLNKGCTYLCTEYTPIPILDITHACHFTLIPQNYFHSTDKHFG